MDEESIIDQLDDDALALVVYLRQQLQAAEQRAAEAEAHLRAVTRVEWMTVDDDGNLVTVCPWCRHSKAFGHRDCPRQAAAAWLEAGE